MRQFGIGQPLRRFEDLRFVTGQGCYTDDLAQDGQLHGFVLRAPVACGAITALDVAEARAAPGVHLVLTAAELAAEGVGPIPCAVKLPGGVAHERPVLADDRVCHAGEGLAFIVADSLEAARDAAELIMVDFADAEAVCDVVAAASADAPRVHPDTPGNVAFRWSTGNGAAVDAAFAGAAHVTRLEIRNNRVAPTAMEPRAILARFDPETGFTAQLGSQGVVMLHEQFTKLLGEDAARIRVMTPDVGGGFGMKTFMYPEYVLAMLAARRLGRPVKWTADRGESFLSDVHGRDLASVGELAFDATGKILGYRVRTLASMGAWLSNFGPAINTFVPLPVACGPYRVPVFSIEVTGIYTHAPWTDAYRGAGRPEATYLLERLMARAARELGLDQDDIRRRNLPAASEMPFHSATGAVFDSGNFPAILDTAIARADLAGFESRRAAARARGQRRGIGLACYIECTLGDPTEEVDLVFTDGGRIELAVGTQSNGQGHETAWAQVLADRLGIDPAAIDIIQGDTARKPTGGGTGGSRSLQMIGNACVAAADAAVARGIDLLADLHDAPVGDVRFDDGHFELAGSNIRLDILELAAAARAAGKPGALDLSASYTKSAATFPNGCHIAEVEIDPETGTTRIERYTVVDDFGTVINPMLVMGQVHGGVIQGLGQALGENVHFDENGQMLSASLLDYVMPRADSMPHIDFSFLGTPCATNPLGLKGCGEAGTIGACPAAINAILDALAPLGITDLDMPATPLAVWQAIERAGTAKLYENNK